MKRSPLAGTGHGVEEDGAVPHGSAETERRGEIVGGAGRGERHPAPGRLHPEQPAGRRRDADGAAAVAGVGHGDDPRMPRRRRRRRSTRPAMCSRFHGLRVAPCRTGSVTGEQPELGGVGAAQRHQPGPAEPMDDLGREHADVIPEEHGSERHRLADLGGEVLDRGREPRRTDRCPPRSASASAFSKRVLTTALTIGIDRLVPVDGRLDELERRHLDRRRSGRPSAVASYGCVLVEGQTHGAPWQVGRQSTRRAAGRRECAERSVTGAWRKPGQFGSQRDRSPRTDPAGGPGGGRAATFGG